MSERTESASGIPDGAGDALNAASAAGSPGRSSAAGPRVFVDARWTRTDTHDGISRFGASLVEALHRLHPVTMLIHDDRQLALLPDGVPHVKINNPISVRELAVSRRLHALGADVVFSPMQVIGGFRRRYRLVLTLHDLIYYRHPEPPGFLPLPVRLIWRLYHRAYWPQRLLLNRGDAVVTVSETTKDLIGRHRLTRRPVTVVHNAPSGLPEGTAGDGAQRGGTSSGAAGAETPREQPRDLVYMGSFMPYKGVETLLAGMSRLPGYRLHLLSRIEPEREAELRELLPGDADVVFWRGTSDADYRELLGRAAALVTASRDEGFGLPVIEAMHAGTPVVCSDLEIFREVTGEHARFFPPGDADAFAAAVRELEDSPLRAELARRGRAQARRFTWDGSARSLLPVLLPDPSVRPDLDGARDES